LNGQVLRIGPPDGNPPNGTRLSLTIDGQPVQAWTGDTVLTAALAHGHILRRAEFDGTRRAGFCLMGACQDCWVWTVSGTRLRACTTPAEDGMALLTATPATWPP